jgi:hypothetical protein
MAWRAGAIGSVAAQSADDTPNASCNPFLVAVLVGFLLVLNGRDLLAELLPRALRPEPVIAPLALQEGPGLFTEIAGRATKPRSRLCGLLPLA